MMNDDVIDTLEYFKLHFVKDKKAIEHFDKAIEIIEEDSNRKTSTTNAVKNLKYSGEITEEEALGFDYCPHCGKEIIEEKITYGNLSLVDKKEVLCMLRRITYGLIQYGDTWETYNKALLIIEHDIKTEEERIKKINEFLDSLNEDEKGSLLLSVLIDTLNYINKGE